MSMKLLWGFLIASIAVIVILAWLLIATPVQAPTVPQVTKPNIATTTTSENPNALLHERVHITSPKFGATVAKTFDVIGEAPGNWYFEATFPIQVRDPEGNVLGRVPANAQGEWMTEKQVTFKATLILDSDYSGPATLILLRDNPSGLPENDDSLEIPIVIK